MRFRDVFLRSLRPITGSARLLLVFLCFSQRQVVSCPPSRGGTFCIRIAHWDTAHGINVILWCVWNNLSPSLFFVFYACLCYRFSRIFYLSFLEIRSVAFFRSCYPFCIHSKMHYIRIRKVSLIRCRIYVYFNFGREVWIVARVIF